MFLTVLSVLCSFLDVINPGAACAAFFQKPSPLPCSCCDPCHDSCCSCCCQCSSGGRTASCCRSSRGSRRWNTPCSCRSASHYGPYLCCPSPSRAPQSCPPCVLLDRLGVQDRSHILAIASKQNIRIRCCFNLGPCVTRANTSDTRIQVHVHVHRHTSARKL